MAYFFTDHFKTQLAANQAIMDNQKIRLVLFRYAPALGVINPAWTTARTVAELVASSPGWVEVSDIPGYPLTLEVDVTTRVLPPPQNLSRYVMFSTYPFSSLSKMTEVRAIGVERVAALGGVTHPLLFVTTTPIEGVTNVAPGDALTARQDSNFPDATNRWLLSWSTATPDPIEGPLLFSRGSPEFEVSGSQHIWMYPQRANMIANPNFEKDTAFWSANAGITRVAGTAPGSPSTHGWAGTVSQASMSGIYGGATYGASQYGYTAGGKLVLESNTFPALMNDRDSEQWTVQLMAKGSGELKVGLVYWDANYLRTSVNWGDDESWDLSTDSWMHIATHRRAPEAHVLMVRLELNGDLLTFDNVLCERGYLKDWPYFDGDDTYGARDDFSWYGGSTRKGASYSLWYNHRRAVTGRLFARLVDPNDPAENVTDEDMEEQGLVYRWVPAGITVVPHLDIFYPFDAQNPLPPKAEGVLPTGPDGVTDPWV